MEQNNIVDWLFDGLNQSSEVNFSNIAWEEKSIKTPKKETSEEPETSEENENFEEADVAWDESEEDKSSNQEEDKSENIPFHKHPRFQELRQAKKDFEQKYNSSIEKIQELELKLKQLETWESDWENINQLDINALKKQLLSELENKIINSKQTETNALEKAKKDFNEAVLDMQDDWIDVDNKEFAKWITKLWDLDTAKTVYSEIKNSQKDAIKSVIKKKSVENISNKKVNTVKDKKVYSKNTSWWDMIDLFKSQYNG